MRKTKTRGRFLFLSCACLLAAANALSQESSSKPGESSASAPSETTNSGGPTAALKAVLSAACSQNQTEFLSFLTVRNREAFSRMTPLARVALMKRFVLLNEPGRPTASANPAGRPILRCQTPDVTTEMQIGGAELRDNIAFLPMELRSATGANVHQITMGLVREDGEWKLLSLGLLLLDLPALEVEWDAAEMESTEREAIEALKKVSAAVEAYRNKYLRLPESLANLGPPFHGAANGEAAGFLDSDLANGMKNGYAIRYVIVGASTLGAPAKYALAATPLQYGRTGRRSFFRDSNGAVHAADRRGAVGSEADPKVE
ncbi:MAG TPA: hypothetical protein VK937_10570 [Candidatus Limnocylindria bacterium]|nr:hypothetical protein [Candidatus Limnocylindria bacterium]